MDHEQKIFDHFKLYIENNSGLLGPVASSMNLAVEPSQEDLNSLVPIQTIEYKDIYIVTAAPLASAFVGKDFRGKEKAVYLHGLLLWTRFESRAEHFAKVLRDKLPHYAFGIAKKETYKALQNTTSNDCYFIIM